MNHDLMVLNCMFVERLRSGRYGSSHKSIWDDIPVIRVIKIVNLIVILASNFQYVKCIIQ